MIYSSKTDIVPYIKNLVTGLQPYARANRIRLLFSSTVKKQEVFYQPFLLSQSAIHLICNLINLLPPESLVKVRLFHETEEDNLLLEIENTNLDLIYINEVKANSIYSFTGKSLTNGTLYSLSIPIDDEMHTFTESKITGISTSDNIPQFYKEIQKRLNSHFTQTEKLMASLEKNRPYEAAFMQKINTLIKVNLENENFGTEDLCNAMFLSRTQLFRKMKSLIGQAPANYIRSVRLKKAKEILETSDLTITEVAYKTGFQSINHFTKIFKDEYGIPPSVYRNKNNDATNE